MCILPFPFLRETVLEVMDYGRKVRYGIIDGNTQEPAIGHIHIDLFQCTTKRWNAIDVLDESDFKENDGIDAWSAVVFAVKIFYEIIYFVEVNG